MVALTWEDQYRQLHPGIDWDEPLPIVRLTSAGREPKLACKFCSTRFGPSAEAAFDTMEEWRYHMFHEHGR
jgi:hypothetical protein